MDFLARLREAAQDDAEREQLRYLVNTMGVILLAANGDMMTQTPGGEDVVEQANPVRVKQNRPRRCEVERCRGVRDQGDRFAGGNAADHLKKCHPKLAAELNSDIRQFASCNLRIIPSDIDATKQMVALLCLLLQAFTLVDADHLK